MGCDLPSWFDGLSKTSTPIKIIMNLADGSSISVGPFFL
jgi:hypothetical protein